MALSPGARVGPFEILAPLGAGGMGEVYRARDTRLGRDVALKVLPDTFARDPERLARFDREARTLATLNHPHIAQLHGIEESAGGTALVMEFVEGEDLAQRIARGAVPLDEALPMALQIADALEAAHEAGIIHRDLKPSNIKVRPDGTVKVLDFGLAKALDAGRREPVSGADGAPDPRESPTITSPAHLRQGFGEAGTVHGVILGTAAYMAPEQARGKTVDRRADIWAFGCVLYEMLAGAPAFPGETTGDVISAVLRAEPARSARIDRLPPRLRELLDRCLQKDPRARWQHMGDVRVELERLTSQPEREPNVVSRVRARGALLGAVVGLVVVAAGALLLFAGGWRAAAPDARSVRFSFALPPEAHWTGTLSKLAISPDGRRIAYAVDGRLFVRAVDQFESAAIAHAGHARYPFFSPDGNWLGFHSNGKLQRVSLAGGAPLTIAAVAELTGASWGPDDTIVFGGGVGAGLLRVAAGGGNPSQLTTPSSKGEVSHGLPHFLPDGRHIVFAVGAGQGSRVAVLSLADGDWRELLPGGTPQYLTSGHLVFSESGNLRIVPFDGKTARVTGPVTPAVDGIVWENLAGLEGAWFAVSRGGDLVFVPGARDDPETAPVWVDRSGRETPIAVPPGLYVGPAISPDGRHVGFSRIGQDGVGRVWILDLVRGRMFPIVSQGADYNPTWTPDTPGRLTYTSNGDLYETLIGRQDPPLRLLAREYYEFPTSWSADGRVLAFMEMMPTRTEIWTLEREQPPVRLFDSSANSGNGMFSPAGPWLAYVSDETGQREVYVRRHAGTDRGVPVSADGGEEPVWSRDGRELFYRRGDRMMAVKIATTPDLRVEQPVELWRRAYFAQDFLRSSYGVGADGRFLMLKRTDPSAGVTRYVNVALNWLEDLRQGSSAR